jgi:LysM repeat protein
MNDDYLWNKTGQPDPEIQQLEEILGTLRYQPKPLVIPDDVRVPRRRNYFPLLAIAASILLAIVAGSIWLRTRSRTEAPKQQAHVETPTPKRSEPPQQPQNKSAVNPPILAVNRIHRKRSVSSPSEEALMAKEQLMLALRITTEKLSLVHTRTQPNQIKNQHRVG